MAEEWTTTKGFLPAAQHFGFISMHSLQHIFKPVIRVDNMGNLKDSHLSDFFKRVAFKKGQGSVTARKFGVIIDTMVT